MDQSLFDICVVNFNTKDLAKAALGLLKKATAGMPCDIWVVDNGSTDGSVEMLKSMQGIRFLHRSPDKPEEGHIAHAAAIDLVFERTGKTFLVLMHTDTLIYQPSAILMLLDAVSRRSNIAAAGCLDQTYHGVVGQHLRKIRKRIGYFRKVLFFKLGLRASPPRIPEVPVHIRSFFSIWNVSAMKREGLRFNMANRNPGYEAQDVMMGRGYLFVFIPSRQLFRYLDHLEAATVAGVKPYHFKHRRSRIFRKKMERATAANNLEM